MTPLRPISTSPQMTSVRGGDSYWLVLGWDIFFFAFRNFIIFLNLSIWGAAAM